MKKTLVALALTSVAGFAFAGSSVTLYGVIDGGVKVAKNKGADTKVSMANGVVAGNRWGIKGVEDLGNGNSVFFQLEQGFRVSNGTTTVDSSKAFSRQTNVGLRGSWGEFSLGRFGALSSDCGSYSILGGSALGTSYYVGNISGALSPTGRYNNSIIYVTPKFAGLQVSAMYSNGINEDTAKWSKNGHYYGLGATYAAGGFNANAIVEVLDNKAKEDQKSTQLYTFGASYDFGAVALYGAYQFAQHTQSLVNGEVSAEDLFGATNKGANQHGFSLSLSTPVAGGKLALQGNYAFGKAKDTEAAQDKYSVWSVGTAYTYPLSKRTTVYGYAGYGETDKAIKAADKSSGLAGYAVALGLKHTF